MRVGITVTGIVILAVGLIVAGAGFAYTSAAGEWAGGIVSVVGLITGIAGAAAKKRV